MENETGKNENVRELVAWRRRWPPSPGWAGSTRCWLEVSCPAEGMYEVSFEQMELECGIRTYVSRERIL